MTGLSFKVENKYDNYLNKIFDTIDVENYNWDIVTDDIFEGNNEKSGLFHTDKVTGKEFKKIIANENYYMIFVDLKAYPVDSIHSKVESYEDYINGNCQIILLCIDSVNIYFYCKNESVLKKVYNNCIINGFSSVEHVASDDAVKLGVIAF